MSPLPLVEVKTEVDLLDVLELWDNKQSGEKVTGFPPWRAPLICRGGLDTLAVPIVASLDEERELPGRGNISYDESNYICLTF